MNIATYNSPPELVNLPLQYLPEIHLPEQDSMCALYFRQNTETSIYRHDKNLDLCFSAL